MQLGMKSAFVILAIGLTLLGLSACLKEKEPEQPFDCASSSATYNTIVKPIIDQYCTSCHRQGGQAGHLKLTNYQEVKSAAQSSVFLKSIKHEPGAPSMPKGASKLSTSNIEKIECWINQGFKE